MLIGIFVVLLSVFVLLIEKCIRNWGIRFALVTVVLIVSLIVSGNVGLTVGRSMEENRFNRNLMLIFSSLRDYEEGEISEALDGLKQRLSDGGEASEVENLLNYLEWSRGEHELRKESDKVTP